MLRSHLEHCATVRAVSAPGGCAIEVALAVHQQGGLGIKPIFCFGVEVVEYGFLSGKSHLEYRAIASAGTKSGCSIEVTRSVDDQLATGTRSK